MLRFWNYKVVSFIVVKRTCNLWDEVECFKFCVKLLTTV